MHRSKRHPYSITSSARASAVEATVRPSAFAVLGLITSYRKFRMFEQIAAYIFALYNGSYGNLILEFRVLRKEYACGFWWSHP
jgi:hypothetical protein